jgi:Uroporphyrinogen decarboxylase (URO-D)
MTNRDRIRRTLRFEPVDRLPVIEWAPWWDKTVSRWHAEGLSPELTDPFTIRRHLGLDDLQQCWIRGFCADAPGPTHPGGAFVAALDDYRDYRQYLYPDPPPFSREVLSEWAAAQAAGELAVWITLEGFFWFPRTLLGIEPHLYAFYDQPDLMHEINRDLLAYNLRCLDAVLEVATPDFMTFAEDMSYNHGPMISREQFDEFIAPYYREIVPRLKDRGVSVFVDTDGDVTSLVPWMLEVGVEGFLPLERMAGVDVNQLRRDHPGLCMIGGFDKTTMHRGEARMREEFERLLPVMRSGGYIPAVDHQTPPEVSLQDYRLYLRLLREYAERAVT